MSSRPDVGVVIVAAGRGLRAGGEPPKQFRLLAGVPMLAWSLIAFLAHPAVTIVVVVLPDDLAASPPAWLAGFGGDRVRLVAGGAERIDSVERGVAALGGPAVVVVHDGARPFVGPETIERVIDTARRGRGGVAAVAVSDTLKRVTGSTITGTVERGGLWRAQTPQAFPADLLARGLARARAVGLVATDDAAMVELAGGGIEVVPDQATNFKVTTAADLVLAEAVARSWR